MFPGVPSLGGMELLIILAVVLLFGARRLPQLGRSLGQGLREFHKGTSGGSDGNNDGTRELKEKRGLPREEEDNLEEAPAHTESEPTDPREELSAERKL